MSSKSPERKNRKKLYWLLTALAIIGAILSRLIFVQPLVIDLSHYEPARIERKIGDKVRVLDNIDFDHGNVKAYLFLARSDRKAAPPQLQNGTTFVTEDRQLLKRLRQRWVFTYTGADMATVESRIVVCKDGHVVFDSGIVLDPEKDGLQSVQLGWLNANPRNTISDGCSEFEQSHRPIIILR